MQVKVWNVDRPSALFERGGPLEGFDRSSVTLKDVGSDRARRLREALGAAEYQPQFVLGRLPDGRWVMLDFGVNARAFAVEE